MLQKIGRRSDVTEEDEARIAAAMLAQDMSHTRGWYRINAIRNMSGGAKLTPPVNDKQAEVISLPGTWRCLAGFDCGSLT